MFLFQSIAFLGIYYIQFTWSCPSVCKCGTDREVKCNNQQITDQILKDIAHKIPASTKTLYITGNPFTVFPTSFFKNMRNLTKLVLDRNQIKRLEDRNFEDLVSLQMLSMQKNKIESISKEAFAGLKTLAWLDLKSNQISKLQPGIFDHFQNSNITLDFSYNVITEIPNNLFSKLKMIKELKIISNRIQQIGDRAFENITINSGVYLIGNNISHLLSSSFAGVKKGFFVIHKNNINCSCDFYNQFASAKKPEVDFIGKCSSPPRIKDLSFSLLLQNRSVQESCAICNRLNISCNSRGSCLTLNRTHYHCQCEQGFYGVDCQHVNQTETVYQTEKIKIPIPTIGNTTTTTSSKITDGTTTTLLITTISPTMNDTTMISETRVVEVSKVTTLNTWLIFLSFFGVFMLILLGILCVVYRDELHHAAKRKLSKTKGSMLLLDPELYWR